MAEEDRIQYSNEHYQGETGKIVNLVEELLTVNNVPQHIAIFSLMECLLLSLKHAKVGAKQAQEILTHMADSIKEGNYD